MTVDLDLRGGRTEKFSELNFIYELATTDYLINKFSKEREISDIKCVFRRITGMDMVYSEHIDGDSNNSFSDILMIFREDGEKNRTYLLIHFLVHSDELDVFGNYDKYNPGTMYEYTLTDIPISNVLFECDIVPSVKAIVQYKDDSYLDKCSKNKIDLWNRIDMLNRK